MGKLQERGHIVLVLTSNYEIKEGDEKEEGINRSLCWPMHRNRGFRGIVWLSKTEFNNQRILGKLLKDFRPDIVSVWGMNGLSMSLLNILQSSKLPVVFSIFDWWMLNSLENDPWINLWKRYPPNKVEYVIKPIIRSVLSPFLWLKEVKFNAGGAHFFSEALRKKHETAGLFFFPSEVIYYGVDTALFCSFGPITMPKNWRLLYVGQICEHKGVHTAIQGLSLLKERGINNVQLDIVGSYTDDYYKKWEDYKKWLNRLIDELHLNPYVHFFDKCGRNQLPRIYREHDVLLFPSIWEEPFGIAALEAMACGLPVVGTATGGNRELLLDGETGLVFPPEDAHGLADKLELLFGDDKLYLQFALRAVDFVKSQFRLEMTVERFERFLDDAYRLLSGLEMEMV